MESLTKQAPAKVNLYLEILGKRDDGFHELTSLMHTLTLADQISFTPRDDGQITLTCDDPSLPCDDGNIVVRAAKLLAQQNESRLGATIHLEKQIPHGAGLGGGSSDAATTLMALNQLWGLGLSLDQLSGLGAELGSDVPFFLRPPAALVRGRGEKIDECADLSNARDCGSEMTLIFPNISVSTPKVYQSGAIDLESPRIEKIEIGFNRLQAACLQVFPEVGQAIEDADAHIAGLDYAPTRPVLLCGSGSSFIYFWENAGHAAAATKAMQAAFENRGWRIFRTQLAEA